MELDFISYAKILNFWKNFKIQKFLIIVGYFLVILLFTIVVTTAIFSSGRPFNNKLFAITSGSMRPKIPMGSLVFVEPQKRYQIGDVITFRSEDRIVSHRIVSVNSRGEAKTKGDANNEADRQIIKNDQILGQVVFSVPRLGRLLMLLKTKVGVILLVVLPGAILIWQEINLLVKALGSKRSIVGLKTSHLSAKFCHQTKPHRHHKQATWG